MRLLVLWALLLTGAAALLLVIPVRVARDFKAHTARDATFESSDGKWAAQTVKIKGLDFRHVVSGFECYKATVGRPELTLVRVTFAPMDRRGEVEWKVPYRNPSGKALRLGKATTPAQDKEIARNVEASLAYWQAK